MISQITLIATLALNHKLDTLQMIYFPIFFNNSVCSKCGGMASNRCLHKIWVKYGPMGGKAMAFSTDKI